MLDFGALPPEINSGRIYVGAGSAPLLAAASAWAELAVELRSAALSFRAIIEGLGAGPWTGPSSVAMAAAAARYVAWTSATGAQAEEAASQAMRAAGAYETAFAAAVPPPVISANRALLTTLVATNVLGQNTPSIAATEAQYAEMWAQDAAAMYAYAASSASAMRLTPFSEPQQIAGAAEPAVAASTGSGIQAHLSQLMHLLPGLLPPGAGPTEPMWREILDNWNTIWSALTGSYSLLGWSTIPGGPFLSFGQVYAWAQNGQGAAAYLAGPKAISGALAPLTQGASAAEPLLSSAVGGSMGKAALVSGLSVPQGWTQAAPVIRTLARVLPANLAVPPAAALSGADGVFGQMALSSLAGRAVGAAAPQSGSGGSKAASLGDGVADPAAATIIVIPAIEE